MYTVYISRVSGDQAGIPGPDGGGDGGAPQRVGRRAVDLEHPGAYRRPTEPSPVVGRKCMHIIYTDIVWSGRSFPPTALYLVLMSYWSTPVPQMFDFL